MMTDYIDYNAEKRAEDLSKLRNLRAAVRFGYKDADRPAYLRQLKHCMKYGNEYVLEAKRIRKWDSVKPPKFD